MDINENDDSPEAGAARFWTFLSSDDPAERSLIGGLLHPRTRNRAETIISDFDSLDRPALRSAVSPSGEPDVVYASIVGPAETVENQRTDDAPVLRVLTMKWEPTLKFWGIYSYGNAPVQPSLIP